MHLSSWERSQRTPSHHKNVILEKLDEHRIAIQSLAVAHDFANRRIFERSRIIEAQGVTRREVRERDSDGLEKSESRLERLDEDLEYLKDVERANEAVGRALQKQIVAFVREAVAANKVRDAASSMPP